MVTKAMAVALLLSTATINVSAPASADPAPPPDAPSCVYTLSDPQLMQVGETRMVTATIKPFPCFGSIIPNDTRVCLEALGDNVSQECAAGYGAAGARVYQLYRPGVTYIVTGRGCGSTAPQGSSCSTVGPISVTL